MIHAAVSPLQLQPSLHRLDVSEDRFRLHGEAPARARDDGIPCAEIPLQWKPDLGPPAEARGQLSVKPLQEALLTSVPDRIAGRKCPKPDLQADDAGNRRDLLERQRVRHATLEAPKLDVVHTGRCADRAEAQSGADTRTVHLLADDAPVTDRLASAPIRWSSPGCHWPMVPGGPSLRLNATDLVSVETRTIHRAGHLLSESSLQPTDVSWGTTRVDPSGQSEVPGDLRPTLVVRAETGSAAECCR
jgi:hypothetical protein